MLFELKSTFDIANEYVQDLKKKNYFWTNDFCDIKQRNYILLALVVKGYPIYLSRELINHNYL